MTTKEPVFQTQINEFGKQEKVDTTKYSIRIVCAEPGCFQVRFILPQDRTQTKFCKLHTRKMRLRERARRARDKRAKNNNK